jgi:hypothetical protein
MTHLNDMRGKDGFRGRVVGEGFGCDSRIMMEKAQLRNIQGYISLRRSLNDC